MERFPRTRIWSIISTRGIRSAWTSAAKAETV
jgi:hypothetical protein